MERRTTNKPSMSASQHKYLMPPYASTCQRQQLSALRNAAKTAFAGSHCLRRGDMASSTTTGAAMPGQKLRHPAHSCTREQNSTEHGGSLVAYQHRSFTRSPSAFLPGQNNRKWISLMFEQCMNSVNGPPVGSKTRRNIEAHRIAPQTRLQLCTRTLPSQTKTTSTSWANNLPFFRHFFMFQGGPPLANPNSSNPTAATCKLVHLRTSSTKLPDFSSHSQVTPAFCQRVISLHSYHKVTKLVLSRDRASPLARATTPVPLTSSMCQLCDPESRIC